MYDESVSNVMKKRIRRMRRQKGFRQSTMAGILGISGSTLSRAEKNPQLITVKTLNKIADLYGVTVDYLMGKTDIMDYGKIEEYSLVLKNIYNIGKKSWKEPKY